MSERNGKRSRVRGGRGSQVAVRVGVLGASAAMFAGVPAEAAPPSSNYKLVFADEFSGMSLDTMKWGTNYSWGNTHNHAAYMDASQIKFQNGSLNLQAVATRHPNARDFWHDEFGWQTMNYTSGAIHTAGKFTATTGYFEASIRMPDSLGSWPAFWMLRSGWPPEIDVMEFVHTSESASNNTRFRYYTNFHYTNASNANASYFGTHWQGNDLTAGYNLFGLEWTTTRMRFFLNGAMVREITDANAIADASNMYLILNHAVGGWAGAPPSNAAFPSDMLVDYVRVFQVPASTAATTTWSSTAATGNWDTAANWSVQVPKFEDVTAVFRNHTSAAQNVTWSNSRTVGGITLDSTTTAYTLGSSGGGLQLARSSGSPTIDVPATNTQSHTISARLELYDTATVVNNSAATVTLAGVITGDGGMNFDGPGTIVVSNNNTYLGDTTIDSGAQGPAVVRVNRSRPFGSVGTVRIGPVGNATTARLEILDSREVPNAISLAGRSSGTAVAIQSLSGTNTLSGTLSLEVGGGNYLIQSDGGGLMQFTGAASGAGGVSIRGQATGARTVTLQGDGSGLVSGQIVNGNATIALRKAGNGTWRLSGLNSYGGTTTVSVGTLRVDGSHVGGGAYSVAAGATLAGSGTIDPVAGAAITVAGTLAPGGETLGSLTVGAPGSTNDVLLSGELLIELASGGVSDRLVVNGVLDLTSPATRLRIALRPGGLDGSSYTLATFTPGTLGAGRFAEIYLGDTLVSWGPEATYVGVGYGVFYNDAAGLITLTQTMVPEPAGLAGVALAAMPLARRRRRS